MDKDNRIDELETELARKDELIRNIFPTILFFAKTGDVINPNEARKLQAFLATPEVVKVMEERE